MQNAKRGLLVAAGIALGALLVCAPNAQAQTTCVSFSTVQHANNPGDAWIGEAWYTFGNAAPVYAHEVTGDSVVELSSADVWMGTEKSKVDFGNGDTFQLTTRWLAHHTSEDMSEVTEIGTVANGTGKFANVSGVFFSPGTFGALWGDPNYILWIGSRQGTICGLDAAVTSASPTTSKLLQNRRSPR